MTVLELTAETVDLRAGEEIILMDVPTADDGCLWLSPEDCITLSRALVHAAAEALGVK